MRSSFLRRNPNLGCRAFWFALLLALVGVASVAVRAVDLPDDRTALDRYVAAPDTNYNFSLVQTVPGKSWTTYVLEMTSQAWLTTNEVDRPLWKHWLIVVKPDTLDTAKSLLFIGGGANGGAPPKSAEEQLVKIALATKSVVSELKMVPNQPLVFAGETQGRSEDSLIAYCWDKFLRTGDEKWPTRLPMTKAAVRAMDTVTAFCGSAAGGGVKVDGFFVAGASKRGWTAWTTAAVDQRVIGIAPIVIDLLNIEVSLPHHYAAYGFWTPAIGDYTNFRIMDWTGTPQYRALMKIEDPYEYRARFTMPKFILNAAGDQFFLPDSSRFYFDALPGIKYLRYVPNTDHSLKDSDAYATLEACYDAVIHQTRLPEFSWKFEGDGTIRVTTKDKPTQVAQWEATNPTARDFRLETFGAKWQRRLLSDQGGGVYVGRVGKPSRGWSAFFVELTFPRAGAAPVKFTTAVRVVPDVTEHQFTPQKPTP